MTAPAVAEQFRCWDLTPRQRWYLDFNLPRYEHLLATIRTVAPSSPSFLDVGPSFQTELIRAAHPESTVDTLGFEDPTFPARDGDRHWHMDLNDIVEQDEVPAEGPYDVIVMAEVIEHLYTPPAVALRGIANRLSDRGRLILQTPNAVALHKRILMLAGHHPFGPISEDRRDPMHFREYTLPELVTAASEAGLRAESVVARNYFQRPTLASRAYNGVARALPRSLRAGITITFAKG